MKGALALGLFCACALPARPDVALFLEDPFGAFGGMNPTGHAAVYLSRVCAETPVRLRRCEPGESGVVISRYHRVSGYDWIAIPLIPYLFAVEELADVPPYADTQTVARLRDGYRRRHLRGIVPDGDDGNMPGGEWVQLVGSSYDRRIYSFEIETSEEQDYRLITHLNAQNNSSRFNLLFHNCADFARSIIDFYYPHAVRRSFTADAGITTPKQVAKSLVSYSSRHDDLQFTRFVIPQVPGTMPRSKATRGVLESLLKSKKYAVPLAVLHPLITGTLAIAYLTEAGCDARRHFTRNMAPQSHPEMILATLQSNRMESDLQAGSNVGGP